MHWTPHVDIAHRAIGNAADGDESSHGAWARQQDDYWYMTGKPPQDGPKTDVMFHAARPGERNRMRDQKVLDEYGAGWEHSRDEDEFSLKPGSPVRLTGISWKEHHPEAPLAPYEHADFPRPVRHVSSRQEPSAAPRGKLVIASHITDQVAIPAAPARVPVIPAAFWEPETAEDCERLVRDFPALFRALHEALEALAVRMDEQPVTEEVPAIFRRMAAACLTAAEDADRLIPPLDGDSPEGTWQGPRAIEPPKD